MCYIFFSISEERANIFVTVQFAGLRNSLRQYGIKQEDGGCRNCTFGFKFYVKNRERLKLAVLNLPLG